MNVQTIVSLDKALTAMTKGNMSNTGDLTRWADHQIALIGVRDGYLLEEGLKFRPASFGNRTSLPLLSTRQAAEEVLGEWDDVFSSPGTTVSQVLKVRNRWAKRVQLPERALCSYQ